MPQLDKVTFLSQFFWLCFFYLGFYYLVLKYFLPKISRILTLRKKKMHLTEHGFPVLQQENQQVRQNLDNILCGSLSLSRNVFSDFLSHTTSWLNQNLVSVNKTHYKSVNNSYLETIGDTSLSQNIMLYHASSQTPKILKGSVVVDKIQILRKMLVLVSQKKKQQDQKVLQKKTPVAQDLSKKSKKSKKQ